MSINNKSGTPVKTGDWATNFVHHWKYYLAPARASPSDIKFIESKIKEKIAKYSKDNVNILILGATPEYRSLCAQFGVSCCCFDFSKYNYEYLSKEVKNKPKETFVEGNWAEKVIPVEYDVILGDNVLNLVFKDDLIILLENVKKMLKKDGVFMPRTFVMDKNEKFSAEEAVKRYRREGSKTPIYSWLGRDFYLATQLQDMKKGFFLLKDMWLLIADMHKKGLLTDKELEEFSKLSYENREFKFFLPLREDFDKLLKEFFTIKEIFYGAESYLKDKFQLHVLLKK